MKTMKNTLGWLVMATALTIGMTACSSDENIIKEATSAPSYTYTMTVKATKGGDATTRALTLDGSKLNASWATTEHIYVKKNSDWATGSLSPNANAVTANLSGKLTGVEITVDDNLILQSLKSGAVSYTGQKGTLADIAENFDYAFAAVTVTSVNNGVINASGTANFTNRQAIIKFTLLKEDGTALPSNPSALTVTDGTSTVELTDIPAATYTTNGDGVLFVAFPAAGSSKSITLTAQVGGTTYTYTKDNLTFNDGSYYDITVKMKYCMYPVALSAVTAAYIGGVVTSDGYVYQAKTDVPVGKTAVGILGKVTETSHGLILALQDATSQTWNNINDWASVTTYAGTTLKLLPDDTARGSLLSYTTLGSTTVSNWCVAQKSDYEDIFTNLGSTIDSDGKTYDNANVNAYITTVTGGIALSGEYWSAKEYHIITTRAWYFYSMSWARQDKSNSSKVRPVLAF